MKSRQRAKERWEGEVTWGTHRTRTLSGRFGAAGRPRAHKLDISTHADPPLPKLDTFLRLCVKNLRPPFHIQLKFEAASKIISQTWCAVCFTPVDQCAPTHGLTKKKMYVSENLEGISLLVSDSELSSLHWSPSLLNWRKFLLQTSQGWDVPTGATWLWLATRRHLVSKHENYTPERIHI